jgi:hypothetical protein
VCTGGEEGGWPAGKGRKREGGEVAGQREEKEREGKKRENGGLAKGGNSGEGENMEAVWASCGSTPQDSISDVAHMPCYKWDDVAYVPHH